MKQSLRLPFLLIAAMFITFSAKSQSDKFAYTVTDSVRDGVRWNFLRKIDLRTGNFSGILLRLLNRNDTVVNSSLCNAVAAIGLDNKNKRLYFTPMLIDRLSYVDLRTMRIHVVTNNFTGLVPKAADQGNIITRMVIGDDDNGYALTNDGNHLIRFNTRNNRVRDLGALIDARSNEVSVHEVCSSFGGDIISGEDDEILYLITSRNHVFKINVETMVARYTGTITGLSETFTTSGAAVDYRSNRVIIGSATDGSDIYSVDFRTLAAHKMHAINSTQSADLSNSNSLKKKRDDDDLEIFVKINSSDSSTIRLYPNPITDNEFKINFEQTEPSVYFIEIINVTGQLIMTKTVNLTGKNNIVVMNLPGLTTKGIYIVKITDKTYKAVFNEKIIIQ